MGLLHNKRASRNVKVVKFNVLLPPLTVDFSQTGTDLAPFKLGCRLNLPSPSNQETGVPKQQPQPPPTSHLTAEPQVTGVPNLQGPIWLASPDLQVHHQLVASFEADSNILLSDLSCHSTIISNPFFICGLKTEREQLLFPRLLCDVDRE
jgi:hypothetical protein